MIFSWGVGNDDALCGFALWLICRPVTFFGLFDVCTRLSGAILMLRSSCADKSLLSVVRGGVDFLNRVIGTLWFYILETQLCW